MNEKIKPRHLERVAFVYLRQSSPTQERKHVEGKQRQIDMVRRAEALGWPRQRIVLVGGDSGKSGSTLHGRAEYREMLEAVVHDRAGILFGRELSRLLRDHQDWNYLVRVCRYQQVLLGDEHRVYDAADPQDRVLLGIQGAFSEYELSLLRDRMLKSLEQKARRGEMYDAYSPGYVCRHPPLYEKHPDGRVQRAVLHVFEEFDRVRSVLQLHQRLLQQRFQLPVVPHGRDWREVQWCAPRYHALLRMLQNPVYAGIYARGRTETRTQLDAEGHPYKRRYRTSRENWDVFLPEHHEAYITPARWERNMKKIGSNANMMGALVQGSPRAGRSLVAGLVRCQRCGRRMRVTHAKEQVRYTCPQGRVEREGKHRPCFSFSARRLEQRLLGQLLEVVSPAGLEAAREAAERLRAERDQQRQLYLDRIQALEEEARRAEREYKQTDPAYLAVRQALGAEWEAALQALEHEKARLAAFEEDQPPSPTPQQREALTRLGQDLERLWFHPKADPALKKQIVRILIEEVLADVEEAADEILWKIHWTGGHHTELREPRSVRQPRSKDPDLKTLIDTLRKVCEDRTLAISLNREGLHTPEGETWTARRVRAFRRRHQIPPFDARKKEQEGWLSLAETAISLDVSPMSVTRLIQQKILPAEQPFQGLPAVVKRSHLDLEMVKQAVQTLKRSDNRPLSQNPNQLSLFATTNP